MDYTNDITTPERWLTKRELAAHYRYSVRWVEAQIAAGMPSRLIGGQRRLRISETDRWLLGGEGEG